MIDAHQHFWTYDPAEYAWISPALGALRRDLRWRMLLATAIEVAVGACALWHFVVRWPQF